MARHLRVLNVEDSERDVFLLTRHLTMAGYAIESERVETAETMRAALETKEWDIILCDYSMPTFNAMSALAVLHEVGVDIPFIIISGTVGEDIAVEAMLTGANDYLPKNNLARLIPAIERETNEAENRRARQKAEAEKAKLLSDLENQRRRLNNIITSVPGVVWEAWGAPAAATQQIDFVSDYIESMLGYSVEEWLSTPNFWLSLVHPEDKEHAGESVAKAFAGGESHVGEFRWIAKDGQSVWVEARSVTIVDEKGIPVGMRGVTIDVTERKLAEEALKSSEARYRTLFDHAPDGILIADPQSFYLDVNDEMCRMLGYTREELIGLHASDIVSPDEMQNTGPALDGINTGYGHSCVWQFRRMDGTRFEGEVVATKMPDDNLLVVVRDITARKRAENERRIVFEIIQGSITTPNLDEFLKLVHRSISQIVYSENCFVMLHDESSGLVHFEFWADTHDPAPAPCPAGKGFSSYVLSTGQPLLLTAEARKRMVENGDAVEMGTYSPSWVGVPLRTPLRTIGVMVLQHYENEDAYSQSDLEFLTSVGDQIALAVERKRAEESVRLSEKRYRLLFEKNPEPMWVYDLETLVFLEVNNAAVQHYGYSREEFRSMTIKDIRPPEDVPALMESVESPNPDLQGGQSWTHRKKDGTLIDVEIASHALIFAGIPGRLVLAKDITESKRAQEALSESEERYRDLVENAIDIIYTHDLEGNYTSVNRAGERIMGYAREEALKLNLKDVVAPEYGEKAMLMIAAELAGEEVPAYDLEIIARDGHHVAVEINTRVIYEHGIPISVQGIARDITERKQLEGQFLQSQKMEAVGLLAGGIAHDFNNLLTAINGYSDLTLMELKADDPLRSNIKEVRNAGERAAVLTRQLLAFSRKQVLKPEVHNLNSVITEIERMLRRIIKESIEFETVLDPNLGNIKADPGRIEQVIMNLAVNARDAMPNGGKLTIETENVYLNEAEAVRQLSLTPGAFIKMTVRDTGQGMDAETRMHIFEPFFTTKDAGKGTGLGLSTVHGIIRQSGGDIVVRSEIGAGTSFEIYLPCVDENVGSLRWIQDGEEDYSGTETILLVEDDEIVRSLVREILTGNGYNVLDSASGEGALSLLDICSETVHLLLTDIVMPGMSGGALRNQVIEQHPDIKVIFMSGYHDDSLSLGGALDSATDLLEKPFTPDALSRKVRELLES